MHVVCSPGAAAIGEDGRAAEEGLHPATADSHNIGVDKINDMEVLYVMDPNSHICFEEVYVDDFVTANLLPWVRNLKDELTRTPDNPDGEDLKVRNHEAWYDDLREVNALVRFILLFALPQPIRLS
jgi:hypothetical protein